MGKFHEKAANQFWPASFSYPISDTLKFCGGVEGITCARAKSTTKAASIPNIIIHTIKRNMMLFVLMPGSLQSPFTKQIEHRYHFFDKLPCGCRLFRSINIARFESFNAQIKRNNEPVVQIIGHRIGIAYIQPF